MKVTRKNICDIARTLEHVKYHHEGRNEHGVDCVGVPYFVANKLGLEINNEKNYSKIPDGKMLLRNLKEKLGKQKDKGEEKEGDILLMRFDNEPQHVAILLEGDYIIHSYIKKRKVVLHRYSQDWKDKVICCFEFPNLEEEK